MDFIVGLPPSRGQTTILVVVDWMSKYAHFGGLPSCFIAQQAAQLFLDMVVKHHGFPISIISDRNPIFRLQQLKFFTSLKWVTWKTYHVGQLTNVYVPDEESYVRTISVQDWCGSTYLVSLGPTWYILTYVPRRSITSMVHFNFFFKINHSLKNN